MTEGSLFITKAASRVTISGLLLWLAVMDSGLVCLDVFLQQFFTPRPAADSLAVNIVGEIRVNPLSDLLENFILKERKHQLNRVIYFTSFYLMFHTVDLL